jgi:hypothetical protein
MATPVCICMSLVVLLAVALCVLFIYVHKIIGLII